MTDNRPADRWDDIIDEMEDTHGAHDHFDTTRAAVREAMRKAVAETSTIRRPELTVAKEPEYTAELITLRNLFDAMRIAEEIERLTATRAQLKASLVGDASYENRSVRDLYADHPLSSSIEARIVKLREQMVGLI